jgi:hypothetical protein
MKSFQSEIELIINEQKSLSALSLEVEKVLKFYEEHPNYPLDYGKVRTKLLEVYSRINKSITELQRIQTEEKRTIKNLSGEELGKSKENISND